MVSGSTAEPPRPPQKCHLGTAGHCSAPPVPPCHLWVPSGADPWHYVHPKTPQDLPGLCTGQRALGHLPCGHSPCQLCQQLCQGRKVPTTGKSLPTSSHATIPGPALHTWEELRKIPAFSEVPGAVLVPGCLCSTDCTARAVWQ